MSTFSNASEAFDFIANIPTQLMRVRQGRLALESGVVGQSERAWIGQSVELLEYASATSQTVLTQHLALPELEPARVDYAKEVQNQWVDALEKLYAGITYHAGSRAPILEALFPKQKPSSLRRASHTTVTAYQSEFEKRALGSYAQRMLSSADFEFATPILNAVRSYFAEWNELQAPAELTVEQKEKMRLDLIDVANSLVKAVEQSRLLAKAALLPLDGVFEELELHARPKRRALRMKDQSSPEESVAFAEELAIPDDAHPA